MDVFLKYWPILAFVAQGVALWIMWSMRQFASNEIRKSERASEARDQALGDRITSGERALSDRVGAVTARVEAVENEIDNLPTKADLAQVEGKVGVVDAKLDLANRGIERLEGYFLTKGVGASG